MIGLAGNHVQYSDTDRWSRKELDVAQILPQINLAIISNICHGELSTFSSRRIGVDYTAFAISFQRTLP